MEGCKKASRFGSFTALNVQPFDIGEPPKPTKVCVGDPFRATEAQRTGMNARIRKFLPGGEAFGGLEVDVVEKVSSSAMDPCF